MYLVLLYTSLCSVQVLLELHSSRDWAALHVADNSCFHFRAVSLKIYVKCVHHNLFHALCFDVSQNAITLDLRSCLPPNLTCFMIKYFHTWCNDSDKQPALYHDDDMLVYKVTKLWIKRSDFCCLDYIYEVAYVLDCFDGCNISCWHDGYCQFMHIFSKPIRVIVSHIVYLVQVVDPSN